MKNEKDDIRRIEELLSQLPEREVPGDINDRVMDMIIEEKPSFLKRLKEMYYGTFVINIQPAKCGMLAAAVAAAFFLGSLNAGSYETDMELPVVSDLTSEASYYIGRGLYEGGEPERALVYLKRAAMLDPGKPEYGLWQAVAFQAVGDSELERKQYQRMVSKYPNYLPALLNLGHNQLENGDLDGALASYRQILALNPQDQSVLYNIGLIYKMQGDAVEESKAWRQYLSANRTGRKSYRAVSHLNEMGRFDFRTAQLGYRQVVIHPEALLSDNEALREHEISWLAEQYMRTPGKTLNIVVFDAAGQAVAKERAMLLREELLSLLPEDKHVNISWFGQAEMIVKETKKSALKQSVLVFSQPDNLTTLKERRI